MARDGLGLDDAGRDTLAACDVVVHSAASVAFDSPLDAAVEVNLLGPARVATAIESVAPQRQARFPDADPTHLVSVSTAYVAGTHQGEAAEILSTEALRSGARARTHTTVTTEVDIDAEVRSARRLRADLEAESRRSARLARFTKAARAELGGAGTHLLAERAEKLRDEWVCAELVEAGRARAQALGWPDAYAFTKALGERALVTEHPDLPISIVRPSIIESAIAEPRPGWIRGFRMAEPIIVSYARGLLREFPGVPEGVIDVIPVDLVVAAIIAVAAAGPDPDGPSVYQVASGVRKPLRYGELVDLTQSWFLEHPLYDADGQPIVVPEWSFPGRGRVQRQLQRATKAMSAAERVLGSLPVRGERAATIARLEERRTQAERALGYVELYGAYTETEARFRVDRLLALFERLSPADQATFCFDPGVIDWAHYVREVHLPSVIEHARVRTTPGKSVVASRPDRARKAILSPDRHLAAFDLENTLIASNVVESYTWLASRHLPVGDRMRLTARHRARGPGDCSPSTDATGATSCAASTDATRARPPSSSTTTPWSCSTTCSWPSPSRPASPGCASTGHSGTAPSSSRARSTSSSRRCGPSSTKWSAPSSAPTPTAGSRGASTSSRPPARPAPWCWPSTRPPRAWTSASRSPMPTRRPTCRCSSASGSRWR